MTYSLYVLTSYALAIFLWGGLLIVLYIQYIGIRRDS